MVKMNRSDILKIQILKQYKLNNIEYSPSYLSDILKSKFETVRKALEFLISLGIIEKDVKQHREKKITYYSLSGMGNKLIKSERI